MKNISRTLPQSTRKQAHQNNYSKEEK